MSNLIVVLTGKASCGKDTVLKMMVKDGGFLPAVSHTTRPPRVGETHGEAYYFIDDKKFKNMEMSGKFVETRNYTTKQGVWYYGLSKKELDSKLSKGNVGLILDKQGLEELLASEYGDRVVSFFVNVDDDVRALRYMSREPITRKSVEECARRFQTDDTDFQNIEEVVDFIIDNPTDSGVTYSSVIENAFGNTTATQWRGVNMSEAQAMCKEYGVEMLDEGGNLKPLNDVIEELANKFIQKVRGNRA